jgi:MATE efflux family protein
MLFLKQSVEERREMIINGSILNTLLFLSIPTLLVGIIQALIPLSDNFFLTNLTNVVVAGSVTFSQPVLNIMVALSQGLGVAAMAMIGKYYGKGIMRAVRETMLQIYVFSFIIGLILIPICILMAFVISKTTSEEIRGTVFTYIAAYSFVMPLIFLAAIYNSSKNAIGRPEVTFIRISLLLVLKIFFNSLFLYIFRMGLIGAVAATFCSYVVITLWMFHDVFVRTSETKLDLRKYSMKLPIIMKITRIGLPAMINYMLIYFGFFLINKEMEKYGAIALTGQGIAANINSLCFNLPSSIGTAVTTMISINMGLKNIEKSKKIFTYSWITSVVIAVLTIILIVPLNHNMIALFTRNKEIAAIADNALNIFTYSIIGFGIFTVCQGVYVALGKNNIPLVMSILRIWLFRYVFILVTQKYLGLYSIFWGNLFSNTVAGIIFFFLVKTLDWENIDVKKLKIRKLK